MSAHLKPPPLWTWVGRVRIEALGGNRAMGGRVRDVGELGACWAAWRRGDSEARGFVRCWLMQARAYEHTFVEALQRRARRPISQARLAEPVAGEFERADHYFEEMGKLGSALEREFGSVPASVAAA